MSMTITQKIEKSPFKNIYWFSRHLLNTDQYGALGKEKEKQFLEVVTILESLMVQNELTDEEKYVVCKETLAKEIEQMCRPKTKKSEQAHNLVETLYHEINSLEDIIIFCITVKYVVAPLNHALITIPSDDEEFARKKVESILNTLGEEKVSMVVSTWDKLGVRGCLDIERAVVIEEFTKLIDNVNSLKINHEQLEDNLIYTAFVQEFERRLGQKRKARSGHSLESVVDYLFEYYKLPSAERPEHFNHDLEIDKWFKCKDGWTIGISCKRTLRERWKQLSQADDRILSSFKIKELWHIITYDYDLSDEKLVTLGKQRQIFYLSENSDKYKRFSKHIGMKEYVRPLSQLVSDIKINMNGEK